MVSPFLKQFWVASGVLTNIMGVGMALAYPYSLLPGLRADDSAIKVDLDSASFLASCVGTSAYFGFLGSSFLMEAYGRKWTHIVVLIPGFLGWLLIRFATNYSMLLIGRLLGGITAGGTVILGAIVIAEYTSPAYRGIFLSTKAAMIGVGALIIHILTNYFSWRTVALISLLPQVIALFNMLTWPESPSWLASKNRFEECERSFLSMRGRSKESTKELSALIEAQKKRATCTNRKSCVETVSNFLQKCCRKDFFLPVLIIFFSSLLHEACGKHVFPAYALDILSGMSSDRSQTFLYTLCMDLIITGSAIFCCFLVKIMPRRSQLFSSGIASVVVLLAVSLYLYLSSKGIIANDRPWIPCSMLFLYLIVSNVGCTSIPLFLIGEIFPLPHRGAGAGVTGLIMSFALMLALQATPKLIATVNVHGTFAVFALVISLSLLVLYFVLPETKDKTLQEIEDDFNSLGDSNKGDNNEARKKMLPSPEVRVD